jgi:hypothetical protein
MPTNLSLRALREANPRNQSGFDQSIERYDALRMQIAATPVAAPRRLPHLAGRRRLIGLSAAGVVLSLTAVLAVLLLTAASPESAYAAAKKAVAATSAGTLDSGTMTLMAHGDKVWTLDTTRWSGDNISVAQGYPDVQLRLVGGEAYVLQAGGGHWTHYPSENVGYKLGPMVDLAHADVAGSSVSEILAATTDLKKTVQPDGSTIYRGTLPNSYADPAMPPGTDSVMRMIIKLRSGNEPGAPGGRHSDTQVELIVGSDGLVKRVSVTFQQEGAKFPTDNGTTTWSVDYSQLGSTPAITAPDASKVVEAAPLEKTTTVPSQTTTTG